MSHEEFNKIIQDFTKDLSITFPEYKHIIDKYNDNTDKVFKHCIKFFSNSYLNILYENSEIFNEDSDVNTEFLPGIVFKQLWNSNITDNTKNTIWKYLQLILIHITPFIKSNNFNKDTSNLFEAINEDDLKEKLQETINNIQQMFENRQQDIPNADSIKDHLQKLFKGKLGKIAMELAEELAKDLGLDPNSTNTQDLFKTLLKNPQKLKKMVTTIQQKFQEKIDSGEIKESEVMEESMEMLKNMKDMPGFSEMFKNMGVPNMNPKKMNVSAMQTKLQQNIKKTKMKERMREKLAKKNDNEPVTKIQSNDEPIMTDEELIKMFQQNNKPKKNNKKSV